MKNLLVCFQIIILLACSSKKSSDSRLIDSTAQQKSSRKEYTVIQEQSQPDSLKGSLQAEAFGKIGDATIKIRYYSPAVRGRIIWGGLVPFDRVWVTGAHSATSIEFSRDLVIEGKTIAAGKYAFFTIPTKKDWTIILNKNWRQHLTDQYDEKQDVVRITTTPEIEDKNQERLRYLIEKESDSKGEIVMYWEKIEISLPFKIK
ncbi:MAG: DUF2911 domain-containing protein [Cytophagales bacterium]|jgi:hypothetical protein|nr:DUF2911 domain-containing protein [Cytophagales bacterium]MCA6492889.1 DUF2911 domain-containing protein [Chitinophagaceae bacterium]MCA6389828.1 DUF2911 domain-containing protein [Cytophagales bacterium]MCA6413668.1 DUF2911 domain-containing protein [Cytophagales bacterium]MCA6415722.1 DUF2911 domain-containing protein [Cytophagales bacterium]